MLKEIAIADLKPGMMVTRVIAQHGPVKIRKVGMIRSEDMLKGLREMGVTKVEVDLSQSLGLEEEVEPNKQQNEVSSATATQRLVASKKRVADVDRQLSQQFHRSLFLPAVEQMPSKWNLYGKPYAILSACIVAGLVIGFSVVQAPKWMSNTSNDVLQTGPVNIKQDNSNAVKQEAVKPENTLENSQVASSSQAVEKEPLNKDNIASAPSNADDANAPNNAPINTPSKTPKQAVSSSVDQPAEPTTNEESPPELVSMNGVLVESGQQVLGYQAPGIDEPEPVQQIGSRQVSQNSDIKSPVSNSDLLRRIQQAADEIDSRPASTPAEPVHVTDLNDLPRIDQLAPAVLTQMPGMSFSAHMYATNQLDRWVRVNGRRLSEGDFIVNDLQLLRIEPDKVVLSFRGNDFTMNALSDW